MDFHGFVQNNGEVGEYLSTCFKRCEKMCRFCLKLSTFAVVETIRWKIWQD